MRKINILRKKRGQLLWELLLVYNRSWEIFGNAQETFLFTVEKKQTQASRFVTIFLRQWKKWLTVFCETSTNYSRQTTWNSSMKVIYKSRLLRSLQWWYNKATLYVIPSIFAVIPLLRRNSDAINQSNLRNFTAYIIIIGNSMICSNIWHKYHKWYFKVVIHNFMSL